jgi:transposase-like protein
MKPHKRRSDRRTRGKLDSPGRPPVWQREHLRCFWQAIALGQTSEDAASSVGLSAPVGARWFRNAGGMPPTHLAPSAKLPIGRYSTFSEREDIALELAKGQSIRSIARELGRSPSTISREVRCNAATRGGTLDYRASTAQWHADRAARRSKPCKLVTNPALRDYVQERPAGTIKSQSGIRFTGPEVQWKGRRAVHRQSRRWSTPWSPEQIARRLRLDFPEDPTIH